MDVPRRHEVRFRVRFDEADASGQLRPSGLLRYAQDLAWQHSEAAGFDRAWYDARGTFWLVRMVALHLHGSFGYGDHVTAMTEVTGWRRVWARRHTTFRDDAGSLVAEADTDWVLLTTEGRPSRIPDEISRYFAPGSVYKPDRVQLGDDPPDAARLEIVVRPADIDPLGHLNNAAYLDILDEAVADLRADPMPMTYRVEYLRPATVGMKLDVLAWPETGATLGCRIIDETAREVCRALLS